jgi:3-oxoacyl-[acyl-carrier protein] reductase
LGSLDGRVALITGSTRRNGKAIAKLVAAAGGSVMITGRSSLEAAQAVAREIVGYAGPHRAAAHIAELTDPEAVAGLVAATVAQFGRLDILINNAGARGDMPLEATTLAAWHAILHTVLDGSFLCAQAAAPHLAQSKHGRIINIGGVAAHLGGRNHAAQTTAKAGIVGLTKALANDLGAFGITVNCVAPGPFISPEDPASRTDRLRALVDLESLPLRRFGTTDELARAVVSLCGDDWQYMTGQTIHVNGGLYLG